MLTHPMDRLIVRNPLRVFWIYRLFIWRSAISDLRYRYAGSAMGVFWNLLIPLLQILILTIVFPRSWKFDCPVQVLPKLLRFTFAPDCSPG